MSVRTEFEIRFVFDMTRPLPANERDILLETLGKLGQLRLGRGIIGTDIDRLEETIRALPVDDSTIPARPLREVHADHDAAQIRRALTQAGTVSGAARLLQINRNTLQTMMMKLGIQRDDYAPRDLRADVNAR